MSILSHFHTNMYGKFGDSMFYILGFMVLLSVVAHNEDLKGQQLRVLRAMA